jgi:hypothetical protein
MAYLQSFDHDVFISYAHGDNVPDREGEKGWVEQFAQQLAIRLLKRFGEPVDIWRDPALGRSQLFDRVIEKAVQGSGVMISLITNRYLHSEYCQQEIKWFCDKAEQEPCGLIADDYVRVFPVLLYNIPPESWPEACRGASAFPFHDASGPEFGEPLTPDSDAFGKQLRNLVDEVYAVLMRLKQHEAAPTLDDADASQASDFTIFMAASSDELRPIRRRVSKALEQQGITVVGDIPPPYEEASHAVAATHAIQQADLCVHLISNSPGEPLGPDNPSKTYVLEQVRLGLEHARSQLILAPDEFAIAEVEDPAYAAFMRELTERPRDADRLEVVRTRRNQMIDAILLKKQALEERAAQGQEIAESGSRIAFIDLHILDVVNAADLFCYLRQKRVVIETTLSEALTPAAGMSLFQENLKKASLYIIVFGAVSRTWVEYRLEEAFKCILSHQLSTQIGIYVAPPKKADTEVQLPFEVMVNINKFDASTLEPLLQKAGVE